MYFFDPLFIYDDRLVYCLECAETYHLAVFLSVREIATLSFKEMYSFVSTFVVALDTPVGAVLRAIGLSEVDKPIIGMITIFVVNLKGRPFSCDNQPRNSTRSICFLINGQADPSIRLAPSANISCHRVPWPTDLPPEHPGFGIVIEDAADVLGGEVVARALVPAYRAVSHRVALRRWWLGSVLSASNARPTRPFYAVPMAA